MKIRSRDIRRLLFFKYEWDESRDLEEVRQRLKGMFQFLPARDLVQVLREVKERLGIQHETHLPQDMRKDAMAMRSSAVDPPMIYFLLLKTEKKGGELILFETVHSWYTHQKILLSMRTYSRNAGIRCRMERENHTGFGE